MDILKKDMLYLFDFFGGIDMSATLKNVSGKFSVKYNLNLILVDEDNIRYFK